MTTTYPDIDLILNFSFEDREDARFAIIGAFEANNRAVTEDYADVLVDTLCDEVGGRYVAHDAGIAAIFGKVVA